MSNLRTIEKEQFEELLNMSGGFVLDMTNPSFAAFFHEAAKTDIYAPKYAKYGDSKAKRLRAFWELESDSLVSKVLSDLLELWSYKTRQPTARDKETYAHCRQIINRLNGGCGAAERGATEAEFLGRKYEGVSIDKLPIDATLLPILQMRYDEAVRCLQSNAPLACIFLCGSILEGLLLGTALRNTREFNQASASPKDEAGRVRQFQNWTLANFIDVACELRLLRVDVKKFSHALRDFRNYIHPYQQMSSGFAPDRHTAEICLQVLRAAIVNLGRSYGIPSDDKK